MSKTKPDIFLSFDSLPSRILNVRWRGKQQTNTGVSFTYNYPAGRYNMYK